VIIKVRKHWRGNKEKKGQSRETGNIEYTRHRTKSNKAKYKPLYVNKNK
jgi:hypothetical protein